MKTIYKFTILILCAFVTLAASGQSNYLYSNIQQAKTKSITFKNNPSVLLQTGKETRLLSRFTHPDEVSFFEYIPANVIHSKAIRMSIPTANKETVLELLEVPESFYDYEVVTSDGRVYPANRQI